nr:iron-containing alcohol dehydrogenase [uncultured Oscillibacter sp.]
MAHSFEFYSPTKVIFGKDAEGKIGKEAKACGASSVMVVYGGGSARRSGLLEKVESALDAEKIAFCELGGVVPNPRLDKVYEGIRTGRERRVDFLLAVGGGSVIDTAKAVAYGLAEPEYDVWELFAHTRTAKRCLPVASVLTIAAAGSETSKGCVITNERTGEKRAYDDNLARPKFAVMNPDYTKTLPDYQTESGCVDIMMHTMERYFTNGGTMEITDALAEGLLRTVMKNAVTLHHNPGDDDARAEIMWAGSLAHNDLTGCGNDGGDFMSHKLEHELGGMFDVTHGAGLAAVWPSWARYVYRDCLPRFVRYARNVMGVAAGGSDEETAEAGIRAMEEFYRSIEMPVNLEELGVRPTDGQIGEMAERCLAACGGRTGSAKKLTREDMIRIYENARGSGQSGREGAPALHAAGPAE